MRGDMCDEDCFDTEEEEDEEENRQEAADTQQQAQMQQIIETGTVTPAKGKHVIHCLTIVGQIEGHYILPPQNKTTKYEHVIPQLVAIQENPEIQGLIIILNTVGGDVEAGLAIAELISGMKKPTVSLVLGGGHSIGVPLAVSARKSFIVPSATMTIHPVRMNGVVLGVPQTLSYFDKMQERIVRFVEENSNITGKQFRRLMMKTGELVLDVGTVLDGQEAVDVGIIDCLGGLSDAINCLYEMIEAEAPCGKKEADKAGAGQKSTAGNAPLASPRAIVQARQNQQCKKAKEHKDGSKHPRRAVAQAADMQHKAAAKNHTIKTAGDATGKPRQLFGNGGAVCNVNPFGHPSPYANGAAGDAQHDR